MAHWALQANPSRYRILQAGLDFDETPWTANQYADQIQVGDKILMWLSGPNSGGYGLGEVSAAATAMPEDPRFIPYWVNAGNDDDAESLPRIRVRITRRMYLRPLLRSQCKEDPVLSQMHIMRQAAGTIFKITNEQWQRVQESIDVRSTEWAREEMILILSLYFDAKAKRFHEPEAAAVAKIARMMDRDAKQISKMIGSFTYLDPESKGKGLVNATAETKAIWAELGARSEEVRRAAVRMQMALVEGGGLARLREVLAPLASEGKAVARIEQRKDPTFARERIELLLPDAEVRALCLTFLADAIERAHSYGAAKWGVTLRLSKRIHLNVGRCLAFGIYEDRLWVGLHEEELSPDLRAFLGSRMEDGAFKTIKEVVGCNFPAAELPEIGPRIEKAYWRFIEAAAGTAKQTPFFYSHAPGVITYLRELLGRPNLPEPVYDWSTRRPEPADDDDDAIEKPAEGGTEVQGASAGKLTLVTSQEEVRASIARFNQDALEAKERVRALCRATTYWILDPITGKFGPGKFVGFAGIDFGGYEAAVQGEASGARFDGNVTRRAIEKALGMEFSSDPQMAVMLRAWGSGLLGVGAFEGARGEDKWKFLALPSSTPKYWKIAPGEQAAYWHENLKSGIIAIGWGQAGDPRPFKSKEELEAHHRKIFNYTKDQAQNNVRMVWCFTREIRSGDIIVANRGQSKVTGRGVVLGPPEFRTERSEYGNCLPVHWFDQEGREVARQNSWFTTILPISAEVYEALFGAVVIGDGDDIESGDDIETVEPQPSPNIYDYLRSGGFHFPAELVTTYLLSLKTKPFVVLSGISGTGKTKLAQEVARWAGAHVTHHEFVSVRPDWLDSKEVLGFFNVLTEQFATRPFLNLLLRAHRGKDKPHFVILDEMNLARVEHYFADLLSVTESRTMHEDKLRQEALHLHDRPKCLPFAKPDDWEEPGKCASCPAQQEQIDGCALHFGGVQMIPPRLKVPLNVYITGTVNIDETTHMFSPKVLDRANVIEFNEVDLDGYGEARAPGEFVLKDGRIDLAATTVAHQHHYKNGTEKVRTTLSTLNKILAEYNLHFGYRVVNEVALYVENALKYVGDEAVSTALDLQLLQKVLPKFHGSKQKLLVPLWRVLLFTIFGRDLAVPYTDPAFDKIEQAVRKGEAVAPPTGGDAEKPSMPRSAAKLIRMLRTLRSQGFVSFIE